jgi:hypothetical protein
MCFCCVSCGYQRRFGNGKGSTLRDIESGKDNHTLRWLGGSCNSMLTHNLTIESTNVSGFVDNFTFDGLVVVCSASVSKHL